MTSRPELTIVAASDLTVAEPDNQQRANAPTLRDLFKAAQERGISGAYFDQSPEKPITAGSRAEDS